MPFAYPTSPHTRVHGPDGYAEYGEYKPWLRDEFKFRCVYCLERETWYPDRASSFSIDHFEPKVLEPDRERDYSNLVYACTRCNSIKQATVILLDPTRHTLAEHLVVRDDGRIEALTPEGRDLIDLLDLDLSPAHDVREETLLILEAKRVHPECPIMNAIYLRRFGFPIDLPNLKPLRPPNKNSRPNGIKDCHYEKRERGELPEVY
jgi:hypothetical protein